MMKSYYKYFLYLTLLVFHLSCVPSNKTSSSSKAHDTQTSGQERPANLYSSFQTKSLSEIYLSPQGPPKRDIPTCTNICPDGYDGPGAYPGCSCLPQQSCSNTCPDGYSGPGSYPDCECTPPATCTNTCPRGWDGPSSFPDCKCTPTFCTNTCPQGQTGPGPYPECACTPPQTCPNTCPQGYSGPGSFPGCECTPPQQSSKTCNNSCPQGWSGPGPYAQGCLCTPPGACQNTCLKGQIGPSAYPGCSCINPPRCNACPTGYKGPSAYPACACTPPTTCTNNCPTGYSGPSAYPHCACTAPPPPPESQTCTNDCPQGYNGPSDWPRCACTISARSENNDPPEEESDPIAINPSPLGLISAGDGHTCVVTSEKKVKCWGYGDYGQLGNGVSFPTIETTGYGNANYKPYYVSHPVNVLHLSNVIQINTKHYHTCSVVSEKKALCFGRGVFGQLGYGSSWDYNKNPDLNLDDLNRTAPSRVIDLEDAVQIETGNNYTCALTSTGKIKCWGWGFDLNMDWENHSIESKKMLKRVNPFMTAHGRPYYIEDKEGNPYSGFTQIATGGSHFCALTSQRTVKCWGWQLYGRLGNGQIGNKSHHDPVDVIDEQGNPLSNVVQISARGARTCALISPTGTVKCWGETHYPGDGTPASTSVKKRMLYPAYVVDGEGSTNPLSGVVQISVNLRHMCALTSQGTVKCWGAGKRGQMGHGSFSNSNWPVDVVEGKSSDNPLSGIIQVSVGGFHTCVITSEGTVKCWGDNTFDNLGSGISSGLRSGVPSKNNRYINYPVDVKNKDGSIFSIK